MNRGKKSTCEKVAEAATAEDVYKYLQSSDPASETFPSVLCFLLWLKKSLFPALFFNLGELFLRVARTIISTFSFDHFSKIMSTSTNF